MRKLRFGGLVAATVVGVLGVVTLAGGPKLQPAPAKMTFRCFAFVPLSTACGAVSDSTDRVRDDDHGDYTGGSIDSTGVFNVNFAPGTRVLNLDLGPRIQDSNTCTTVGNCHPGDLQNSHLALDYFDMKVKPLTTDLSQDLAGGLYAMSCGPVYPALVHYTFWLDGDGHWGLNFNPKAYSSDRADLVRVNNTTWTTEATPARIAELVSWGHSGITRHDGPSHEGRFYVQFKLKIEVAALPSGAGRCSP